MDHGASVEFRCNAINTGAIVSLSILAERSFVVWVSGKILLIEKGESDESNRISSEEEGGKHCVRIKILDWFSVKKCFNEREYSADNIYSFRFYPFLSSKFIGELKIENTYISSVLFNIPVKFKAIWHDILVHNGLKIKPEISHNQGDSDIIYIFRWNGETGDTNHINFDIPVRLGGSLFLKITEYPIYYLMISLSAIALSSYTENIKVMFASLLAVVTFMVKQWGNSDVPQSGTFLTRTYIFTGIMLIIWTLSWYLNKYFAISLIIPYTLIIVQALKVIKDFKYSGELPSLIADYWCREITKKRTYQMRKGRFG